MIPLRAFIVRSRKKIFIIAILVEINEFTMHDDLANMTQIDYDREMAFVAVRRRRDEIRRTRAIPTLIIDARFTCCGVRS